MLNWLNFHTFAIKIHQFTNLVILQAQIQLHHSGVNATLTLLRQCYWIPAGRQQVQSLLRKCVTCKKVAGKPYAAPDPPPLIKDKLNASRPFEVTGVDHTGAPYVRTNSGEPKVYISLFTCAVSRAIPEMCLFTNRSCYSACIRVLHVPLISHSFLHNCVR